MAVFEDPRDVQDPTDDEDILAAWGDIVNQDLLAAIDPPRVRVRLNTVQSIPHDELTKVEFHVQSLDSHNMFDLSEPDRLKQPVGWPADMLLGAKLRWENSVGGTRRYAEIQVNETTKVDDDDQGPSASGFATNRIGTLWFPSPGDYFTLHVYQDSGTNLNLEPDAYAGCSFWAAFAGLRELEE